MQPSSVNRRLPGSLSLCERACSVSQITTARWVEEGHPILLSLQLLLTEQGCISIIYEFPGKKNLLSCRFGEFFFFFWFNPVE